MAPLGLSEPAEIAGCYGLETRVMREAKERMVSEPRYAACSPSRKAAVF